MVPSSSCWVQKAMYREAEYRNFKRMLNRCLVLERVAVSSTGISSKVNWRCMRYLCAIFQVPHLTCLVVFSHKQTNILFTFSISHQNTLWESLRADVFDAFYVLVKTKTRRFLKLSTSVFTSSQSDTLHFTATYFQSVKWHETIASWERDTNKARTHSYKLCSIAPLVVKNSTLYL